MLNQVILFLTDGEPTDSHSLYMEAIKTGNAKLDNKTTIITFGMGSGVNASILRTIANQDNLGTAESSVRGPYMIFYSCNGNMYEV